MWPAHRSQNLQKEKETFKIKLYKNEEKTEPSFIYGYCITKSSYYKPRDGVPLKLKFLGWALVGK